MRHINNYKRFLEDLTVNLTDQPDIKIAKQSFNKTSSDISEYKLNKDKITKIYTDINTKDGNLLYDDKSLKEETDKILGKEEINSGKDRNPFLSQLVTTLGIKRRLIKTEKSLNDDKISLDDFKQSLNGEENEETKENISNKIKDINQRMSEKSSDIINLKKDFDSAKKEHDNKMTLLAKDLKDSVDKINSQSKI